MGELVDPQRKENQVLRSGCPVIQLSIGDPGTIETAINTRIQLCIEESGK